MCCWLLVAGCLLFLDSGCCQLCAAAAALMLLWMRRDDRLATLLAKERSHSLTYIGCIKKGPMITDSKLKWCEKSGHLIGCEYVLYAYGPIYVLSAEVVASLTIARNNRSIMLAWIQ